MTGIDAAEVLRQLTAGAAIKVADARGKAFEHLAEYMFTELGCQVRANLISPFHSEQIDLAVAHIGDLAPLPNFFLVECKYWEKPIDSAAVGYFINTCQNRSVPLAVIISKIGMTGNSTDATAAHSLAYAASMRGTHLILLTESDLLSVTNNSDLAIKLIRAWMEAVATGGVGSP